MTDETESERHAGFSAQLLEFYDELVAFHDCCSFMCDAFAHMVRASDPLDYDSAMGASRLCEWLKAQSNNLKIRFERIRAGHDIPSPGARDGRVRLP